MCGPVSVALGMSGDLAVRAFPGPRSLDSGEDVDATGDANCSMSLTPWQFHLLLNLGRLLSYALVGAAIGGLGAALLSGGQLAGVGSELRRWMTLVTGGMLIWLGLLQIAPGLLPGLPIARLAQQQHERLSRMMVNLSLQEQVWTPLLLGLCWGMIPCGFLYAAQIRAAETGSWWLGSLLMLAFGLGTTPVMVGVGWMAGRWSAPRSSAAGATGGLSQARRTQLYRLGGWVTLAVGVLLLLRRGDSHGGGAIAYGGLLLLMLALAARPLAQLGLRWHQPRLMGLLQYRRGLGVGAFVLVLVHVLQVVSLNWDWNWQVVNFLIPRHRQGVALGMGALVLMLPAALTSFDRYQKGWGIWWRRIHLLTVPALMLSVGHTLLLESGYRLPGQTAGSWLATAAWLGLVAGILILRWLLPMGSASRSVSTAGDVSQSSQMNDGD